MNVGDRIGAILGSDGRQVRLLGYGRYTGRATPEDAVGMLAAALRSVPGLVNPRLLLDDGSVVWGCECWWGSEEQVRRNVERWRAAGFEVVRVRIEDVRADFEKRSARMAANGGAP